MRAMLIEKRYIRRLSIFLKIIAAAAYFVDAMSCAKNPKKT